MFINILLFCAELCITYHVHLLVYSLSTEVNLFCTCFPDRSVVIVYRVDALIWCATLMCIMVLTKCCNSFEVLWLCEYCEYRWPDTKCTTQRVLNICAAYSKYGVRLKLLHRLCIYLSRPSIIMVDIV